MSRWLWGFKAGFWKSLTERRPLVSARAPGWIPFPPTLASSPQPAPAAAPMEETNGDWHQVRLVEPASIAHEPSPSSAHSIQSVLPEIFPDAELQAETAILSPLASSTASADKVQLIVETGPSQNTATKADIPAEQSLIPEEVAAIMRQYEAAGRSIQKETASWIAHDRRLAMQRAEKIIPIIEEHAEKLSERLSTLVTKDYYGHSDFRRWNRERDYFITQIVLPKFGRYVKKNSDDWFAIEEVIDGVIERHQDAVFDAEEARIAAEDDAYYKALAETELPQKSKSKQKLPKTKRANTRKTD